jgi:hypothetical protein
MNLRKLIINIYSVPNKIGAYNIRYFTSKEYKSYGVSNTFKVGPIIDLNISYEEKDSYSSFIVECNKKFGNEIKYAVLGIYDNDGVNIYIKIKELCGNMTKTIDIINNSEKIYFDKEEDSLLNGVFEARLYLGKF